jgi:hypothetical protein
MHDALEPGSAGMVTGQQIAERDGSVREARETLCFGKSTRIGPALNPTPQSRARR